MKARGSFDVTLRPLETYAAGASGINLGRLSIDKVFHGDLQGTSRGEMLSARTAVNGSAGYVAIEQVEAALGDRRGTFVLQHFGTMSQGGQRLILEVVPDSASGELAGLSGTMTIEIKDGKHFYEFDCSF